MNGPLRDGVMRRGRTWSYVIRVTDPSGASRPRWVGGFPTEQAAKAARDEARVVARRGEFVDRSRITVQTYLRERLESHALEVKPRTLSAYGQLIEAYVVPHIGRMRLQTIRPSTLSSLYQSLLQHGGHNGRPLSVRTVDYTHAVLRKAFNDAVRSEQLLTTNPASRTKRPRQHSTPRAPADVWTPDQLRSYLHYVQPHRLSAFFWLAAYTGARRGELLNLRWPDITLDDPIGTIHIRGSVGIVDRQRVEGTTKGGRERHVTIDSVTVAVLRAHRDREAVDRDRARGSWIDTNHVFRREIGAPLFPSTPTALMTKLQQAYNTDNPGQPLPVIRLHDLRHIHATLLLRAGVPVHVVAARLGHADAAITLRVYAHVLNDQAQEAAETFAKVLNSPADQ